MFIDEVNVKFIAGNGGDGLISWRREKYIPKGGPFGGNGGKGGDIILLANTNINTLSDFRHTKVIKAKDGIKGEVQEMAGASGEDLIINLPVGTIVKDTETLKIICDLTKTGEKFILCKGGRGGYGNSHFASSTRQAPNFAELGDSGEEKNVSLEIKLVADIGIIGLPNAGKSTLIKAITNVKPKIASYPFTTIIPNLGVMEHKGKSLVIEDSPGLIKGASSGKGLGINFLKHIERTQILLHLLDLQELDNITKNYFEIRKELECFSKSIAKKPEVIVLSKADLFDAETIDFIKDILKKEIKAKNIFVISAASHLGINELKDYLIKKFTLSRKGKEVEISKETKIYDLKNIKNQNAYKITEISDFKFEIKGERIEQIVRMTNADNKEAVFRVYDILKKNGALRKINTMVEKKYGDDLKGLIQNMGMYEKGKNSKIKDIDITPIIIISGKEFPLNPFSLDNI